MAEAQMTSGAQHGVNDVSLEYDYIICGGGTSGCVVAARLAEDLSVKVLVLEAGPDSKDLENVHMPAGWSQNFRKETDWNIVTPPQKELKGRQVELSRGRFLGGSSGVNGALCIRGVKQDYDDWDLPGWSGDEVFEYMKKAEDFHNHSWFHPSKAHGKGGPLKTAPHDNAPISDLVMQSYQDSGLAYHEDMFVTGDHASGCGHVVRTIHEGIRSTGADFVTKGYKRDNITIMTEIVVDKVVLKKSDAGLSATGVAVKAKDGTTKTFHAKREVVLSAGAYCSPAVMLRSGIGAKAEVESIGKECKVDLPGVGKNLMDHPIVFFFYETEKEGLTYDSLLFHDNALANTVQQYKDSKTGPMACFPFGSFAWDRLDEALEQYPQWQSASRQPGRDPLGQTKDQPHVEYWNSECYGGPLQYTDFPVDKKHTFSMVSMLLQPKSRGTVTLKSGDADEIPTVDNQYLSDPLDLLVLTEGCKQANAVILNGRATKEIVKGAWPPSLTHTTWTKREEWEDFVRENATTCYHPCGTCKMGKADDPLAVLDEKLRVRGVQGLRVADCSVMPIINAGHTQMPAYAIGEKCADLIKDAAKSHANGTNGTNGTNGVH